MLTQLDFARRSKKTFYGAPKFNVFGTYVLNYTCLSQNQRYIVKEYKDLQNIFIRQNMVLHEHWFTSICNEWKSRLAAFRILICKNVDFIFLVYLFLYKYSRKVHKLASVNVICLIL